MIISSGWGRGEGGTSVKGKGYRGGLEDVKKTMKMGELRTKKREDEERPFGYEKMLKKYKDEVKRKIKRNKGEGSEEEGTGVRETKLKRKETQQRYEYKDGEVENDNGQ